MKISLVFSCLLCTIAFVECRFAFTDTLYRGYKRLGYLRTNVRDSTESEAEVSFDSESETSYDSAPEASVYKLPDVDFDMGNRDFIGVRTFHQIEKRGKKKKEEKKKAEEERKKAEEEKRKAEERQFTTEDGDYIEHDCLRVKTYTEDNWLAEPWNKGLSSKDFIQKEGDGRYMKYNSAYGIPMIGTAQFSDDSMLRGCYLIRYIFAGNQHLRIAARRSGVYNLGFKGGVCCPPQMGDQGLSCQCDSKFPLKGKGASAHEMAHYYIKNLLPPLFKDGRMLLPKFTSQGTEWEYQAAFSDGSKKCKSTDKLVQNYGELYTWVWNAQNVDRLRKTSKVEMCKMHHYMIYAGQQNWLFKGNQKVIDKSRPCFYQKSANLYNLMEKIWPCNNTYVPVCKDAARGFQLGLAQNFTIGKIDPNDIAKVVCKKGLDKPEVNPADVPPLEQPKEDGADRGKCLTVARRLQSITKKVLKTSNVNFFVKYLRNDEEKGWYLRRCCASTLNFDNSVPQNVGEDESYKVSDGTCDGETYDDDEGDDEDDYDE